MADSIGIDIADVTRFQRLLDQYGPRLISRILGSQEREVIARRHDRAAFLAGRFAAKEALIKALGKYLANRPAMSSLEVLGDDSGRPTVHLPPSLSTQLAFLQIEISISHEQSHAVALAVITEKR
ncbi:MAG: holo-ACP synthase [Candidatus Zixiibacteriota bacterium]